MAQSLLFKRIMKSFHLGDIESKSPYELLNTINQQRSQLTLYIFSLLIISILLTIGLIYVSQKPPLVIRIDKLGQTAVEANYPHESAITTKDDIHNFSNIFLNNYVGLRSDLVLAQMEKALNLMDASFAKVHLEGLKENNTIKIVQASNIRNKVTIQKLIYDDVGEQIFVSVNARLDTRPLDQINAIPETKYFKADLALKRYTRSAQVPYGLLLTGLSVQFDSTKQEMDSVIKEAVKTK